jgi:hypothetical protein
VEGGRGADDLVHGDGREVGRNEEEVEGNRFLSLPRAGVLRRGGSTAAATTGHGGRWLRCLGAWEARRLGWGGVWRGGEPVRPFYRCGKVGSARIF